MNVMSYNNLMSDPSSLFSHSGISEISSTVSLDSKDNRSGVSSITSMTSEDESNWLGTDGSSSLEGDLIPDNLSVVSDTSSLCGDDLLGFDTNSGFGPQFLEAEKDIYDIKLISKNQDLGDPSVGSGFGDSLSHSISSTDVINQLDKGPGGKAILSMFEVNYVPLWGFMSVCGRRPEMEDAVAIVPEFMKIPISMLIGNRPVDGLTSRVSHLMGHFFGVYDGHGGSQVYFCPTR